MLLMIAGLVLLLGSHSSRIVAAGWRQARIAAYGERNWKIATAVISLVGFVLVVWGYGMARQAPIPVWDPPLWTRHLAILLNAVAFFLIAQGYGPQGPIVARIGHPMTLAIKVWALAHLIANGTLADIVLFGSVLAWAIASFAAARRRDRHEGIVRTAGPWRDDLIPGAVGLALWAVMLLGLHQWLIGVDPLG